MYEYLHTTGVFRLFIDILEYYHLNEQSFRTSPDPRFLYLSGRVKEVLANVEYMTREHIGPRPTAVHAQHENGKCLFSHGDGRLRGADRSVDEAQNINRDILKIVHCLLNFETNTEKLLQVVLASQEELAQKVLRYRDLVSRMFPIAMNAMSAIDLQDMIGFRWMVASGKEPPYG